MHHPNKIKNPKKKYSGAALIIELKNLNPFGYGNNAMSPPIQKDAHLMLPEEKNVNLPDVSLIRKKRLEQIDVVTKNLAKVQLRYV